MELHNLDELKNLVNGFASAFHDTKMTIKDQIAKDDTVVTRFDYEGVHKGKFAELPSTGKKVKIAGISIMRLVKDKIIDEWEVFDELGLMQQLGMELKPMEVVH
jgi:predicted ester cyclase